MSLPPSEIPLGAMRFNSDSQKLEYWMGSAWMQIQTFSPNLDGGARGLIVGGYNGSSRIDTVEFITISTAGNAADFGNLTGNAGRNGSCASNVSALRGGGATPSIVNVIDEHEFASTGNFNDFGDLTASRNQIGSLSNATRGVFAGGNSPSYLNIIAFVTIETTGDATDFGDLTSGRQSNNGTSSGHGGLS